MRSINRSCRSRSRAPTAPSRAEPCCCLLWGAWGGAEEESQVGARHNRHRLGKGWGSSALLRRARPPPVSKVSRQFLGKRQPSQGLIVQPRRVRATWPDRGWSGQGSSEESGAQVLRGSSAGLGEPHLLSPEQVSPTPGAGIPAHSFLPRQSLSSWARGHGPSHVGRLKGGDGARELRRGGWAQSR